MKGFLALVIYMDDILIMISNNQFLQDTKNFLHSLFTVKDLEMTKYFLGIELLQQQEGTFISQAKYISDIVTDAGLRDCSHIASPVDFINDLTRTGKVISNAEVYKRLVGRLLYLNFTRPYISYITQQLSQFMQHPNEHHMQAALRVLKYLKESKTYGLFYLANTTLNISGYCDCDWASCKISRRSLSGFCLFLGESLVS